MDPSHYKYSLFQGMVVTTTGFDLRILLQEL